MHQVAVEIQGTIWWLVEPRTISPSGQTGLTYATSRHRHRACAMEWNVAWVVADRISTAMASEGLVRIVPFNSPAPVPE